MKVFLQSTRIVEHVTFSLAMSLALLMIYSASSAIAFAAPKSPMHTVMAKAEVAKVFFKNIKEGQTVTSPVQIEFGVSGYKIVQAGKELNNPKAGHHHLIINGGPMPKGEVIPADATHLHFGKGQTEAKVVLPKGHVTLTLQFADGAHKSYGPDMSSTVHVIVK